MANVAEKIETRNEPLRQPEQLDPAQKEQDIRAWIARKESICPYAPGLARFVQLPDIQAIEEKHVDHLAEELSAFYKAKESGRRVGRWMLMPYREWQSHEEAHHYAEQIFWLLNAAYFHLKCDTRSVDAALKKSIKGYDRGHKGEILNPVVGPIPQRNSRFISPESLFFSALSPLYRSKRFYRYSPHSLMPLVYASEFQELTIKHPQVAETVTFEMAKSGLHESFGEDLMIDQEALKKELPIWGAIIDRSAAISRAAISGGSSHSARVRGCPATNLLEFRNCDQKLIATIYNKHRKQLSVLTDAMTQSGGQAKQVIAAAFAGSGLYTIPDYQA